MSCCHLTGIHIIFYSSQKKGSETFGICTGQRVYIFLKILIKFYVQNKYKYKHKQFYSFPILGLVTRRTGEENPEGLWISCVDFSRKRSLFFFNQRSGTGKRTLTVKKEVWAAFLDPDNSGESGHLQFMSV